MHPSPLVAWLYWDPHPEAFTLPFIHRAVAWYGICFVTGFILGYLVLQPIFRHFLNQNKETLKPHTDIRQLSFALTDRLTWFLVLGTIIGARLGHVLFYDFPFYAAYPLDIFKIWEGGLASHGGTVGVIISIALFLFFYRKELPTLTFIKLVDMLSIPTALAVCFIRIGNFINQEILGYPTSLPWGIIFGHPADRSIPEPRHPVSLYEALCYFLTFIVLYTLWRTRKDSLKPGILGGLFFILVFGSRFFIDFFKLPQSLIINESFLQMGQYLSLPFILLGIILMISPQKAPSKHIL